MKFKKLLGGGLLAAVLALGVGAGLAVRSESQEVKATNLKRYTLIVNENSWWKNAGDDDLPVRMYLHSDQYTVELTKDSEVGETITLWETNYYLYTAVIDID